jgi:ribose 1,5-bisphosphokinase
VVHGSTEVQGSTVIESASSEIEASRNGGFVAIVGPSGAGKDTLIAALREKLAGDDQFVFARRVITRESDATESNEVMTLEGFEALKAAGGFLFDWSANGLHYGLPKSLADEMAMGSIVVANVSRGMVPALRQKIQRCCTILITATPEVLAHRLQNRGREDLAAQQARLVRAATHQADLFADETIDNSGLVSDAVDQLQRFVLRFANRSKSGER